MRAIMMMVGVLALLTVASCGETGESPQSEPTNESTTNNGDEPVRTGDTYLLEVNGMN